MGCLVLILAVALVWLLCGKACGLAFLGGMVVFAALAAAHEVDNTKGLY